MKALTDIGMSKVTSPRPWSHLLAASFVALSFFAPGCAGIMGFEEGTPLRDASTQDDALVTTLPAVAASDDAAGNDAPARDATWEADDNDGAPNDEAPFDGLPGLADTAALDPDSGGLAGEDRLAGEDASPDASSSALCSGVCVSAPPAGWEGPFELYEGPANAAPSCVEGAPLDLLSDQIPVAACSCTCDPPTGVQCVAAGVVLYRDRDCSVPCPGPGAGAQVPITAECTLLSSGCGMSRARLEALAPAGTCGAPHTSRADSSAGEAVARLCPAVFPSTQTRANVGSACSGNMVCVPPADAPFESAICVRYHGTLAASSACPDAFPVSRGGAAATGGGASFYGSASDTRSCSPCSCSLSGVDCGAASVEAYGDPHCSTGSQGLALRADGSCVAWSGASAQVVVPESVSGACQPSGGAPQGGVALSDPYTVCCTN